MATATKIKQTVGSALDKWTRERNRALKIEIECDMELLPLVRDFQLQTGEIKKAAQAKLGPIYDRMRELETEIGTEMLKGVNEKTGAIAVSQIENATAIAEVTVDSKRYIPPSDFLAAVPEADRNADFWGCLSVFVTKVDKYLPESIRTQLTKLNRNYSTRVCLKSEIKKKK